MSDRNPLESVLAGLPYPGSTQKSPGRQSNQLIESLDEISGFSRGGQSNKTRYVPPSSAQGQMESLSNTLAQNIAVFPKSNRIVVNEHGVFIPRSLLGQNAEIRLEENRSADGSVRILVSSHQRDEKLKSYRRVEALDCSRELKWLTEHRAEYAGQWVALDGDRLLAHGKVAREVREKAHELGVELPLIVQVESPEDFPFGGW